MSTPSDDAGNTSAEYPAKNSGEDIPSGNPVDGPAPATSDNPAPPPEKRGRGRPPKTEAEKAETALNAALRRAANSGVPDEILAKYKTLGIQTTPGKPATNPTPAPAPAPVKKPPTKEEIQKVERALTRTFQFAGDAAYTFVTLDPSPDFPEKRAEDLAAAWADIAIDYLGENAGGVIKWCMAIGGTGAVVTQSVREVKKHNAKVREENAKKAGNPNAPK